MYTNTINIMVDERNCPVLTEFIMIAIPKFASAKPPIAAGAFLKLSAVLRVFVGLLVSHMAIITPACVTYSTILNLKPQPDQPCISCNSQGTKAVF